VTAVDQHVARRIRGKRRALGLSHDDIAKALGVNRDLVEAYETGAVSVPAEHLQRLSQRFDVPISYFFPDRLPRTA